MSLRPIIFTDEFAYPDSDGEDRTAAMVVTAGWDVPTKEVLARVSVVGPEQTAVVWLNAENAERLVSFLTEEFDL